MYIFAPFAMQALKLSVSDATFVAFVILCWTLYTWLFKETVPGWASIMISFWFCSGSVLTGLGIVGEYVGKIYIEVKDRPRYNIESILTHEQEN